MKRVDWFLVGMAAAMALAWLAPEPGAAGGWLQPELLTKAGVALIFFLHGLTLSFQALRHGALNWRLHLVVQVCTFALFPLLGLGLLAVTTGSLPQDLRLGLFFLCALPSTVSSSVALTAAARGNVAGAVFNATLSSLLGVALTPLWVGWALHASGESQPLGAVIGDLARWLVLPLAIGQSLRPWLGAWAMARKSAINRVDRLTILLLVYTSFCDSFKEGVWRGNGFGAVLMVLLLCGGLFVVVMIATGLTARAWRFSREDRIAAMFCGSKKTLASGVPMAKLIFAGHPGIGLILLPIMLYHPLQLVISGVLAQRWGKQPREEMT